VANVRNLVTNVKTHETVQNPISSGRTRQALPQVDHSKVHGAQPRHRRLGNRAARRNPAPTKMQSNVDALLPTKEADALEVLLDGYHHPDYDAADKVVFNRVGDWASAEYSQTAHTQIRLLISSHLDPDVVKSAGARIGGMGGLQAMQGVFYALLALVAESANARIPDGELTEEVARMGIGVMKVQVTSAWDGIHGWSK